MQMREAVKVDEAVQANAVVRGTIAQPRPGRWLDVLLTAAVVMVIGVLMALLVWVVFLGSEDEAGNANPTAEAGSAARADGYHERYYPLPHGKAAPVNAGVGSAIIHDDAGNVNPDVASATIHDDAWNMPRDASSAIIHDDAGNVPISVGSAVIHDDAGNVNR